MAAFETSAITQFTKLFFMFEKSRVPMAFRRYFQIS